MLRLLDTFSGIGGFSLAARWLGGIETVQFVEREPFCQRILAKHWPDVPTHDDICTYQPERGTADIICAGFPCQDVSTAGKQAGIKIGTRSGLFYELMRVVRMVGPRYIVLENVAAIVNGGLDIVLGELAEAGFDAEWACIPASAVGACHRRDRWWLVAYPSHLLGHGSTAGHGRQCGPGTVPEPRVRNTAGDVAHPHRQRQQEQHAATSSGQLGQLAWRPAARRLDPDWRSYVSEPVLRRGDARLSGRVDRLKALGNAVVPQVAMIPLARVLELEGTQPHLCGHR
jgi:DNA (cytosine-5)-methyltransferase 1